MRQIELDRRVRYISVAVGAVLIFTMVALKMCGWGIEISPQNFVLAFAAGLAGFGGTYRILLMRRGELSASIVTILLAVGVGGAAFAGVVLFVG